MGKIAIAIACTFVFFGCASTLTIDKDGVIEASDYSLRITRGGTTSTVVPDKGAGAQTMDNELRVKKGDTIFAVPNRWFTTGLLKPLFESAGALLGIGN